MKNTFMAIVWATADLSLLLFTFCITAGEIILTVGAFCSGYVVAGLACSVLDVMMLSVLNECAQMAKDALEAPMKEARMQINLSDNSTTNLQK